MISAIKLQNTMRRMFNRLSPQESSPIAISPSLVEKPVLLLNVAGCPKIAELLLHIRVELVCEVNRQLQSLRQFLDVCQILQSMRICHSRPVAINMTVDKMDHSCRLR